MPPLLPLGRLDLWFCRRDALSDALRLRYRQLLTAEEREAECRFRFEQLRDRYLTTRALVRVVLSHYTGHDPSAWRFQAGPQGKPHIVSPETPGFDFNLSHTDGLILCGVSAGPVGVDVESVERRTVPLELARRFFAPSEADALERLPEAERPGRFLEYWTLKESYIKARGKGLTIPLDHFAFTLSKDEPPRIAFVPGFDDHPEGWCFGQIRLGTAHEMAWAIRLPDGVSPTVAIRECVPLVKAGPWQGLSSWAYGRRHGEEA